MAKRRTARRVSTAKRGKTGKIGKPRARLARTRLEGQAKRKAARAKSTLADSAARLGRAAVAKTRQEVTHNVASAREAVETSLDRLGNALAESSGGVKREMDVLGRGLGAGLRAGAHAYRKR